MSACFRTWLRCVLRRGDRGSATAETAVVLPSLVLVLLLAVWAVMVAVAQLRCVDAASTGARALARNEPAAMVIAAAQAAGPPGARVRLARADDTVTVTVDAEVTWPGSALSRLPAFAVSERATAARENVFPGGGEVPP
jgi:TadE-like protein